MQRLSTLKFCLSLSLSLLSLLSLSLSLSLPPSLSVYVLSPNAADTENNFNEDDGWEFVTLADQVILT